MKPVLVVILGPILIVGLLMALVLVIGLSTRASATDNMVGYAWSSNIGWVSFNCTNTGTCAASSYGVDIVSPTGVSDISGYAWSSNIGWLDFSGSGSCSPTCPVGAGTSSVYAQIDNATNQLSGWARFLSNGGGWDGWVSLRGTGYGVTRSVCNLSGFAWGGDVVGWISFNGASYGVTITDPAFCEQVPTANLFVNSQSGSTLLSPLVFTTADLINLSWNNQNVSICDISGSYSEIGIQGAEALNGSRNRGTLAQGSYSYTITCYKNIDRTGGSAADTEYVRIDLAPLSNISCTVSPFSVFTNQTVNWTVSVSNGQAPHAFNLTWNWVTDQTCPVAGRTFIATENVPSWPSDTYTTSTSYAQNGYVCMEAVVSDVTGSVSCTGSAGAVIPILKIPDWREIPPD